MYYCIAIIITSDQLDLLYSSQNTILRPEVSNFTIVYLIIEPASKVIWKLNWI